jgi:hypothetical protein
MSHAQAVKLALRGGDDLAQMIGALGTAEHPRGAVLNAYRQAERNLTLALQPESLTARQFGVRQALTDLRDALRQAAQAALLTAVAAGSTRAMQQADAYGLPTPPAAVGIEPLLAAWLAAVDAQIGAANALVALDAAPVEVLGDASRAGVLRPAVVVAEGSRWLATAFAAAAAAAWTASLQRAGQAEEQWYHQAVAAIDEHTTDCCLRVNGQPQPLDAPFRLVGTPRFADKKQAPPFFYFCRTSEALLPAREANDALTQQMRAAGDAELKARGPDGKNRVEISPADARSRR